MSTKLLLLHALGRAFYSHRINQNKKLKRTLFLILNIFWKQNDELILLDSHQFKIFITSHSWSCWLCNKFQEVYTFWNHTVDFKGDTQLWFLQCNVFQCCIKDTKRICPGVFEPLMLTYNISKDKELHKYQFYLVWIW